MQHRQLMPSESLASVQKCGCTDGIFAKRAYFPILYKLNFACVCGGSGHGDYHLLPDAEAVWMIASGSRQLCLLTPALESSKSGTRVAASGQIGSSVKRRLHV